MPLRSRKSLIIAPAGGSGCTTDATSSKDSRPNRGSSVLALRNKSCPDCDVCCEYVEVAASMLRTCAVCSRSLPWEDGFFICSRCDWGCCAACALPCSPCVASDAVVGRRFETALDADPTVAPAAFLCPLSHCIMDNPMMNFLGHNVDYAVVAPLLARRTQNPNLSALAEEQTSQAATLNNASSAAACGSSCWKKDPPVEFMQPLYENPALREAIEEWRRGEGWRWHAPSHPLGTDPPADPSPPNRFLCPITCEVMRHPVMDRHGHNFEARAIVKWAMIHCSCPFNRELLWPEQMYHNRALEEEIREWRAKMGAEACDDLQLQDVSTPFERAKQGPSYPAPVEETETQPPPYEPPYGPSFPNSAPRPQSHPPRWSRFVRMLLCDRSTHD